MLFLTAYFDESGDFNDPKKNFTGMAGFIAPAAIWQQVEEKWDAIVKRPEYDLKKYVHMKEMAHCQGQFMGWEKDRRDALHKELIGVLVEAEVIPMGCIVSNSAFRSLSERQQTIFKSPYFLCLQRCIHAATSETITTVEDTVAMVFARQETFGTVDANRGGTTEQLYDNIKRHTPFGNTMGAYASDTPQRSIPLQAADFLAYEMTKEFETLVSCPERKMRRSYIELLKAGGEQPLMDYVDRPGLLQIIVESKMPYAEGTEEFTGASIQQLFRMRASKDIMFMRRGMKGIRPPMPKWVHAALKERFPGDFRDDE